MRPILFHKIKSRGRRKVDGQNLFGAWSENRKNLFSARLQSVKNLFGAK